MADPPHHHQQQHQQQPRYCGGREERGDRATAPIEDIWCEKIRGCGYREAVRPTRCPLRPNSDQVPERRERRDGPIFGNAVQTLDKPSTTELRREPMNALPMLS